ncbi:hypothetical protein ACFLS8_04410 [Chloroflexota bacterium]
MEKTGKPIAGGILSIVAGTLHILGFLGIMIALVVVPANVGIILSIVAFYLLATGILPIIGGIYALQRKKWGLALAGAIIAILGSLILGILATVLIALAKDEFE